MLCMSCIFHDIYFFHFHCHKIPPNLTRFLIASYQNKIFITHTFICGDVNGHIANTILSLKLYNILFLYSFSIIMGYLTGKQTFYTEDVIHINLDISLHCPEVAYLGHSLKVLLTAILQRNENIVIFYTLP